MLFVTLTDLPGKKGNTLAGCFKTISGAKIALRFFDAATAVDDNGAINIWRDYENKTIRAQRQSFCSTRSQFTGTKMKELVAWLEFELPLIS